MYEVRVSWRFVNFHAHNCLDKAILQDVTSSIAVHYFSDSKSFSFVCQCRFYLSAINFVSSAGGHVMSDFDVTSEFHCANENYNDGVCLSHGLYV